MAAPAATPARQPCTVIQPGRPWRLIDSRELWRSRELLGFLVWKDLRVRYQQTLLGVAWVLLQPLLAMAVFSVVFGRLAGMPSDGIPYALFAYAGVLPWSYFSHALTLAPQSLVANPSLVRKVYFPRALVPLASVLGGTADLAIGFAFLLVLVLGYGRPLDARALLAPGFLALAVLAAVGPALVLSALNVRYRDVRALIPFLVQIWMFATPVVYPASLVPAHWRALYALNPMVGVVEGLRWSVLGSGAAPLGLIATSAAAAASLAFVGLIYFRRCEGAFADVI
jgi:lipopolysaccharide transport system permease protein